MCFDRPAEIYSLLEKVENTYANTLGGSGYDDGLSIDMAAEIITRRVLTGLLEAGLTGCQEIQKVLQSLPLHPEYLEE